MSDLAPTSYSIERHVHLSSAWAAGRAASVKGCRFSVEKGRAVLEASGFNARLSHPNLLPPPEATDEAHRKWRTDIIASAASHGLTFTDGVAAKLINCYLKYRFVCAGYHEDERVCALHPPVDEVLLKTLATLNVGGFALQWQQAHRKRWSKFDPIYYEQVISLMRQSLNGIPLWKIEEHWKGNQ